MAAREGRQEIEEEDRRKEMQERWERKLRFGGPAAKKGERRSLQAIREEFEKHGARNLNKSVRDVNNRPTHL